jgi:DNA modification methylase
MPAKKSAIPVAAPANGNGAAGSGAPVAITIHCKYDRLVEPGALRFNPLNDNRHPKDQLERLAVVFREIGVRHPVVVSRRSEMVVVGEGRARALQLCPGAMVPVVDQDFVSEEEELSFLAADNKLGSLANRDDAATAALIERIKSRSPLFNLAATGYANTEITRMIQALEARRDKEAAGGADAPPQLDRAQELLTKWGVQPGDVWSVGGHRLMCGDSGTPEMVAQLLAGASIDLCFTSPPYDQQRTYDGANKRNWLDLMQCVFVAMPATLTTQVLVNLGPVHIDGEWQPYWNPWIEWMRAEGWRRFGWYVWDQGFGLPGDRGRFAPSHEFIFHFNRTTVKPMKTKDKKPENIKPRPKSTMRQKDGTMKAFGNPEGSNQQTKIPDSVIRVRRQQGAFADGLDHPAVFPVTLPTEIISAFTTRGGTVYDCFMGSGTSFVAAENLGRRCFGMEISPAYCATILERLTMAFPDMRIGRVES